MRRHAGIPLICSLTAILACTGDPQPVLPVQPSNTAAPAAEGTAAPSPSASPPAAESVVKVDADSPMTTASGATYTAPKGWTVTTRDGVLLLEDPNREVSLTVVERKEPEPGEAIAAAWKQVKSDFARTIKRVTPLPGRSGWDAATEIEYETTSAESRGVWADARRKGDTWYVALFDGTYAGWGSRFPGAILAFQSFRAKGVVEESFRGKTANVLDADRLSKLEAFLEEARKTAGIPGLAVSIIQGGKVVFEKGFGVRELGKKDAVTPDTLFRIASMTKPLTSLMTAALVDEGKFGWETPVTQILPSFALGDADLTKRLTMKSILCACTGIPRDNVGTLFEWSGVTAEATLARMRNLKPTTGFGETFQYSNAMIAAGGFIAAHAADPGENMQSAYAKTMKAKVFDPLGMKATTFDPKAAQRVEHASPHDRTSKFGTTVVTSAGSDWVSALNPAGGAWSNVRDLSKYLLMELGKGKTPGGKRVVSEANLLRRREPQGRSGEKTSYGLALRIETYRDVQVYSHSGGLWGWSSHMFFLPDHGVAGVILSNTGETNPVAYGAFQRRLFELLFDGRDEAKEDIAYALKDAEAAMLKEVSKVDPAPDKAWLAKIAGTYEAAMYGKLTIRVEGDHGILDVGEWKSDIGRKKEEDGSLKVVLTTSPWILWPQFAIKEADGKVKLELDEGQRKVLFEPVKKCPIVRAALRRRRRPQG
jgi:CubicO group peptidase (beta-lactamase class C family)